MLSSSLPLQREPQAVGTLVTRDEKVLKSTSSHFIRETLGMFLYLFLFCVHALPYLFVYFYLFIFTVPVVPYHSVIANVLLLRKL